MIPAPHDPSPIRSAPRLQCRLRVEAAQIDHRARVMANVFDHLPAPSRDEEITELLSRPEACIERIVSTGQSTPVDAPYDQDHDEWVLLLRGAAGLWIDGEGERDLRPGDHLLIPAHCRHRVTWTAADPRESRSDSAEPTVWLAIHFR